jgi:hypothetical protein
VVRVLAVVDAVLLLEPPPQARVRARLMGAANNRLRRGGDWIGILAPSWANLYGSINNDQIQQLCNRFNGSKSLKKNWRREKK